MAAPVRNRLLDTYRRETGEDFTTRLEAVPLPLHTLLYEPGQRPKYVHFLTSGMASIVAVMEDGHSVEVHMAGNESFPESVQMLGPEPATKRCMMQVEGTGLRMPFIEFEKEFLKNETMRRLVLRSVQYNMLTMAQLVACNCLHEVTERMARWLLMVEDRTEDPVLKLTQEYLAEMLGSRRSTVTIIAGNLQRAGLIEYHRGTVKILDREGLEDVACECYPLVKKYHREIYS